MVATTVSFKATPVQKVSSWCQLPACRARQLPHERQVDGVCACVDLWSLHASGGLTLGVPCDCL
eukprot:9714773-Ditylum_brightwellii.AAC.1